MIIKECVSVQNWNTVDKSKYLNRLFIQEEGEYRGHLLLDGSGHLRVNKDKHPFDSTFFMLTLPGDHYTVMPNRSGTSQTYYLTIFALENGDSLIAAYIESKLAGKTFRPRPAHRFIFDKILSKHHSRSLYQKESARYAFLSLLYGLTGDDGVETHRSENRDIIDRAVQFMHEHKYGDLRLDKLCGYINLSIPHFIRIFKADMGLPPMKYFTRIRVEEAAALLMSSDKTLAVIAEDLNFSSPAHFSKIFKQYMEMSPAQYRGNCINTLEKRQNRSLREIEKAYTLLNNIIDESPDLVFFKDINGMIMGCNQTLCRIMGMEKSEIIGRNDYDLFTRERAEFFIRRDGLVFRNNRPYKNEEWMTYPDGKRRKFEVYKAPFHDSEGRILGLIGISRDITDRSGGS